MPKAKPLNRIELTRRKMAGKGEIKKDFALRETKVMQVENEQHFDKCPMCGEMALVHEGGCEHCLNCGHDECGLH